MTIVAMYAFMGERETYKGKPKAVSGVNFNIDDTQHNFGVSTDLTHPPIYGLGVSLKSAVEKLISLEVTPKEVHFCMSPTTRDEESSDLVDRLFVTESDYDVVIASIAGNKKIQDTPTQEGLLLVANALKELRALGIIFSTGYKETKASIVGAIQADSVGCRAYFKSIGGGDGIIVEEVTPKEQKAKTKDVPKLLADNLIFNWAGSGEVGLPDGSGTVYYTGNGELENKTPKGVKVDKVVAKGAVYFTGNNKRLRVLGKISAEDRYNVVILKEANKFLTTTFEHQRDICKGIYSTEQMVVFRKRELFSPGISNYIEANDYSHLGYSINGDIYTTTVPRKDLSYVFNPPRLAFKIKRALENNQTKLMNYINGTLDTINHCTTDITDIFFDKTPDGKCKLRPEINSKTTTIKLPDVNVPGRTVNIKTLLKYDLPERNFFNKLIKDNPTVELLTWMIDDHTIGYGCIVKTDEGWLFYCSVYGSRHLLRTAAQKHRK